MRGECVAKVNSRPRFRSSSGQIVLFPHDHPHVPAGSGNGEGPPPAGRGNTVRAPAVPAGPSCGIVPPVGGVISGCSVMKRVVVLSDVCRGRDNNLNLIRVLAALAVLVSHAWPISRGFGEIQPLNRLTGYDMGALAVYVFFCISGFLIARSFERQPTLRHWLLARALRLFPALLVMLLLMVLVLGPLVTALPAGAYFSHPATLGYLPNNLSLALRQPWLPGVFEATPYGGETNGSLWTLYYEVLCYGAVMVMGLLGAFRRWGPLVAATLLYVAANVIVLVLPEEAVPGGFRTFLALGMPFAVGVAFYLCRSWLPLHPAILAVLVAGAVLVKDTPLYQPALVLALGYGVFVLA